MLTSPVNVTIAANGATLKPHSAPADTGARRELVSQSGTAPQTPAVTIEPELPSQSPMTNVNAVTATAAGRTILQDLSLQVATMLRLARRPDENMTALFIRIIATIEGMPQAERLQFEVRTGLKSQKITLADLAMALRNPNGIEAARLTAISEAPFAVPGKTAVAAATTTYLQEGTADGHTEETLAMRAAARNSAAGQSVFAADAKVRHGEPHPMDAKALQSQLKSMFEPGSTLNPEDDAASRLASAKGAVVPVPLPKPAEAETVTISTSNLRLDADAVEKIRSMAQTISEDLPEALKVEKIYGMAQIITADLPEALAVEKIRSMAQTIAEDLPEALVAEKIRSMAQTITEDLPEALVAEDALASDDGPQPADRRLQTMLTLKGLAEVVAALPAKAAEFLTGVQPDREAPLPASVPAVAINASFEPADPEQLPEFASAERGTTVEEALEPAMQEETPADADEHITVPSNGRSGATATEAERSRIDLPATMRSDAGPFGIPFAAAPLPPARDAAVEAKDEDETHGDSDHDGDRADEDGEKRGPRDEYDAIHDPEPEDEPAIRITRDSSEADRAFALYQRMGGF